MKRVNLLNILGIGLILTSLLACSSDNKCDNPVEPVISEITLDKDQATIIIDQGPITITILTGNGEYKAFALDSKLVNVTVNNNELVLEGLAVGTTEVLLSDRDMLIKKIPVNIANTESIEVGDGSDAYSFTNIQGNSQEFTITITKGNGGYKVVTDNSQLINPTIVEPNIIKITTAEGNAGGEANIRITDVAGLEKTIKITIVSSSDPFTDEFVASITNKEATTSELMFWNNLVDDYSFTVEEVNDRNNIKISKTVGNNWWNNYTSEVVIDYPLDLTSSTNDATIDFSNYPVQNVNSNNPQELELFEVIKDDNESLRAIFKYTDEKDILRYGYIIYLK